MFIFSPFERFFRRFSDRSTFKLIWNLNRIETDRIPNEIGLLLLRQTSKKSKKSTETHQKMKKSQRRKTFITNTIQKPSDETPEGGGAWSAWAGPGRGGRGQATWAYWTSWFGQRSVWVLYASSKRSLVRRYASVVQHASTDGFASFLSHHRTYSCRKLAASTGRALIISQLPINIRTNRL